MGVFWSDRFGLSRPLQQKKGAPQGAFALFERAAAFDAHHPKDRGRRAETCH